MANSDDFKGKSRGKNRLILVVANFRVTPWAHSVDVHRFANKKCKPDTQLA